MKKVFVDTNYFVAVFNPTDQLHKRAVDIDEELENVLLVTTDFVFVEVLNYFSGYGRNFKKSVADSMRLLLNDLEIQNVECSHEVFLDGLNLYESRLDKGYSLTDCISINIMREQNISEILTSDNHFKQEGFRILL